jgi:hypothetical protein
MRKTRRYWSAAQTEEELRENEGHDGLGNPPLKKLKKEWPHGQCWVWSAKNEDTEPDKVYVW